MIREVLNGGFPQWKYDVLISGESSALGTTILNGHSIYHLLIFFIWRGTFNLAFFFPGGILCWFITEMSGEWDLFDKKRSDNKIGKRMFHVIYNI